jgi:ketopantoate reductase
MKVCVVGAGSIGATMGAKLSAAGAQVCLIARGAHLGAIRSHGLQLVDQVGSASGTYRLPASAEPSDFGPQDLEQRRPLELAAIVGAVIELADLTATAVPATRTLHALVQARACALGIAV